MIAITLVNFTHRALLQTSNIFLARPLHNIVRESLDVLPLERAIQTLKFSAFKAMGDGRNGVGG